MSDQELKRKLTAIFYADVVAYSRLTGEDEAGTHKRVMLALDAAAATIDHSDGKVLRYAGDAILAEFSSVVAALEAAKTIQSDALTRNDSLPPKQQVQIRIGVHLGEVIHDRDEIYGDGVNLAARLESAAQPGGICLSATVYEQVDGKIDLPCTDGGCESFKNLPRPVHVYHWLPGAVASVPVHDQDTDATPSVRIETFTCLPHDDDNQVLAQALRDQLLLRISRRTGIRVLESRDEPRPSRGSDYLLRGRINRLSSHCRITLSLIWCPTGETVWAEGFSGTIDDAFALIDQITDTTDAELRIQFDAHDARRLADREESGLSPSELLVKAADYFYRATMQDWRHAIALIDRCIAAKPDDAMALSMRVEGGAIQAAVTRGDQSGEDDDRLSAMADRAIELNHQSDHAFFARGCLRLLRLNDFRGALDDAQQATALSPSYAPACELEGTSLICLRQAAEAIPLLERAAALSSKDPFLAYRMGLLALARFVCGDVENASTAVDRALQLHPGVWTFHQLKGAVLACGGDEAGAHESLGRAAQLADVAHPFAVRLPLPESYREMLELRHSPRACVAPGLHVVR